MRSRRSILLATGFAALLLIIAISASLVWRNARSAQARVAALHEAHMRAGNALGVIRANVYLIGVLVRDYLLDGDPTQAQPYIDQLNAIRKSTEERFAELERAGQDSGQMAALARLRTEFEAYWDPTEIVLDWTPEEKAALRLRVLRQRVKRRDEIFMLASQVEDLLSANFDRERRRITTTDQEFRASLGWTMGAALILGFGIAGVILLRMLKLERQSAMAESELRRLSGQIRTAQEQERKSLSRELHDQVGQMLTGLRMELAAMARLHNAPESELAFRIARSKGTVEQTLRVVRNIAMLLRPSMLDDLGLTPALTWLAKELSRSSDVEIETEIDPSLDSFPEGHRTCLYRVVQEALTNAVRHSGASTIKLKVTAGKQVVSGTIVDNGRGFDRSAVKQKGLGLVGMEERARELGGSLQVESQPGRGGTRVEVLLPCPDGPEVDGDQDTHRGRSRNRTDRVETAL